MTSSDHGPSEPKARSSGAGSDGMDRYPTYQDGRGSAHPGTGTKPTDSGLPRSRKTSALPFIIGLAIFALAVIGYLVAGGFNMGRTTDDALTPGDPATPPPAASAPAGAAAGGPGTVTATEQPEAPGSLDRDVQPQTQSSPGEVEATPGAVDVPGGQSTTPVEPTPAQ